MTRLRSPPDERDPDERRAFGVINLDKPPGPTSHQVVAWVKDLLGVDRAAHAGTLDPKATGCLPVLVGDATRAAGVLVAGRKRYVTVLELHDRPPTDFDETVQTFTGEIYQKPPRKSAVRRQLRVRRVHDIQVLDRSETAALVDISCESGTYIRKLCHHLGLAVGVGAHMGALRRVAAGPFTDRDLVTLHDLADAVATAADGDTDWLNRVLQPAERALDHLPTVTIAPSAAATVAEGAPVYAPGVITISGAPERDQQVVCMTPGGTAICLGRLVGDPKATSGTVVSLDRVLV